MLVPDNLKSAVIKACRYDPQVNPHYQHLAQHFGVSIMPDATLQAKRQGQGRSRCSGSRTLDFDEIA